MAKTYTQEEVAALEAEVKRLQGALQDAASNAEEAQARAAFFRNDVEEMPTGKKIKVLKAKKPWARNVDDQELTEEEQETYFYKIDLPPVGGVTIRLDGQDYFHGQTYEVSRDTLRTLKEAVHRIRDHEATIHGTDENAYRPKSRAHFSGKVMGRLN